MKLTIAEEGFSTQMLNDVEFSPENLDVAYIEQASLFAYYAEQSRLASKKMDNFKLRINTIEAELDKECRDEAISTGTKVTEKAIEQSIARNDKYIKSVLAFNDAKATHQMLRDILDAFKQRKDMLMQIGLTRRDELKAGSMRVNESSQDELRARRESLVR